MCQDSALTYLNYVGYNVIALPRESIDPLLVLGGKDQRLTPLGALSDFVIGDAPLPAIARDEEASKVQSQRSSRLDLAAGLGITERFLEAMGTRASLKGQYRRAAQIQLVFEDVRRDSVVPQHINDFLDKVEPKPRSLLLSTAEERGRAWIITDTIKSRSFGVIAFDENGEVIELDAKGLGDAVGGDVKIGSSESETRAIYYRGKKWLRFGFKAMELTADPPGDYAGAALHVRLRERDIVMRGTETQRAFMVFTPDALMDLG